LSTFHIQLGSIVAALLYMLYVLKAPLFPIIWTLCDLGVGEGSYDSYLRKRNNTREKIWGKNPIRYFVFV